MHTDHSTDTVELHNVISAGTENSSTIPGIHYIEPAQVFSQHIVEPVYKDHRG